MKARTALNIPYELRHFIQKEMNNMAADSKGDAIKVRYFSIECEK